MSGDLLSSNEADQIRPVNVTSDKPNVAIRGRLKKFIKRWWILLLVLVLVVAGTMGWLMYRQSQEQTWKNATDYYTRADYAKAASLLKQVGMPSEKDRLRVYAQTMLATRDLEKAEPAYKKLFEATKDPADKLALGNIYNEQKKYDQAIRVYQEVISNNKNSVQAYVNLTIVHKLQGNVKEATSVAKEAVANNPQNASVHELLVSMLMENKNTQEYKDAVAGLRALNPEDSLLQSIDN
ncbi:MAG: tetratricopeptide repeat protein [Spartobacteria bacterium]|nr:tetratricopeptide repeat protein [Spartobacteria bacterium]NCU29861.1 tetratricopeptide repeat protein [Candidatus Saccharibacteria bacterium]